MKTGILILSIVLSIFSLHSCESRLKNMLFIGNSIIYYNEMPKMVQQIAQEQGITILIEQNTVPNYFLREHATNSISQKLMFSKKWDFLIVNESNIPLAEKERFESDLIPGIEKITRQVEESGNEMYMIQNAAFKRGWYGENVGSYELQQNRVIEVLEELSQKYKFDIIRVGEIWRKCLSVDSTIELWAKDDMHPSIAGSYLEACVIYCTLFKKNIEGLEYKPPDLSATSAELIRKLASETKL